MFATACSRPAPLSPPATQEQATRSATLEQAIQKGARASTPEGLSRELQRTSAWIQSGRLEAADRLYRTAIASKPEDPAVLSLGGDLAMARGDYQAAARLYGRAFERRPGDPGTFLRLYEAYLIVAPGKALTLATRVAASMPDSPGAQLCVAEACVFDVVTRRLQGVALEDRLRTAKRAVERCQSLGGSGTADADGVRGEIAFLEARFSESARYFQAALKGSIPNADRASDMANALALVRFRANDLAGARAAVQRHQSIVASDRSVSGFRMLPKWEQGCFYRLVLLGEPVSRALLHQKEADYQSLRSLGVNEFPESLHTRKLLWKLYDLRGSGRFREAAALARDELRPQTDAPRYAPACFYSKMVDEPMYTLMLTTLLGDLERDGGRPAAARAAYRQALALAPASNVLRDRIHSLGGAP